jgi:hypothetical protein
MLQLTRLFGLQPCLLSPRHGPAAGVRAFEHWLGDKTCGWQNITAPSPFRRPVIQRCGLTPSSSARDPLEGPSWPTSGASPSTRYMGRRSSLQGALWSMSASRCVQCAEGCWAPNGERPMSCKGNNTESQPHRPRVPGAGLTHGRGSDILRTNHLSALAEENEPWRRWRAMPRNTRPSAWSAATASCR